MELQRHQLAAQQETLDLLDETFWPNVLESHAIESRREELIGIAGPNQGGHRDEWYLGGLRIRLQMLSHFAAIHPGQMDVTENQVKRFAFSEFQRFLATVSDPYVKSRLLKQVGR